jgi:DNA-binding NarL/FixJ family response regulator
MIEKEVLYKLMVEEGKTQSEIAKMLGVVQGTVSAAARRYGFKKKKRKTRTDCKPKNRFKIWTPKDDDNLEKLYGLIPYEEIATRLGRTIDAVKFRVRYLELGKSKDASEFLDVADLAKALGRKQGIVREWILKNELPATYKIIALKKNVYRIDTNDFWKWCKNNLKFMKWEKYERNSLGKEPKWLDKVIKEYYKSYNENRQKKWSKEDEAYLKLWEKQGIDHKKIAKRLKRSVASIESKLNKQGKKRQRINISWKPIEVETLLKMKKQGTDFKIIADELGRSRMSVTQKYIKLTKESAKI